MMKKKRYKFHVDINELELSEVSYSKAILFAKVRQLDGGNFSDVSKRMEVQNHRVQYNARFQVFNFYRFPKMFLWFPKNLVCTHGHLTKVAKIRF